MLLHPLMQHFSCGLFWENSHKRNVPFSQISIVWCNAEWASEARKQTLTQIVHFNNIEKKALSPLWVTE